MSDRPPIDAEVWGETALLLPDEVSAVRWSNALTGETLGPFSARTLPVARVLGNFPVGLLEGRRE